MKIFISPQAFKGTITAMDASKAMAEGALRIFPNADVASYPICDGGDGTLDMVIHAKKGTCSNLETIDALGRKCLAPWGIIQRDAHPTAVIEMARICGLATLLPQERNPLIASTYGLGLAIRCILDLGIRRFLIGLGGSATNDGGAGMVQALGVQLLDKSGCGIPPGGDKLFYLDHIDMGGLDPRLLDCHFTIACDVTNPLVGTDGATRVYSKQKGATSKMTLHLEKCLCNYADIVEKKMSKKLRALPGTGAAGGTGFGFAAFLDAKLCQGATFFIEMFKLEAMISSSDLVITGEGCMDAQTIFNKAPIVITKYAKAHQVPVLAIVGSLGPGYRENHVYGIDAIIPLSFAPRPFYNQTDTFAMIADATEQALRCMKFSLQG